MLKNIQRYIASMEDFEPEAESTPVETVDATNVEASIEPEADVVEAADEVAQETPTEEIAPDGDLEVVEESSSVPEPMTETPAAPVEGATEETNNEVSELLNQADAIQNTQEEIIAGATSDAEAIESGNLDVNGNTVPEGEETPSEAVVENSTDTAGVVESTDVQNPDIEATADDGGEASDSTIVEEEIESPEEVVEETSEVEAPSEISEDTGSLSEETPTEGETLDEEAPIEELPGGDAEPETTDELEVVTPELQGELAGDETPVAESDEPQIEETAEEVQEDAAETETAIDEVNEDAQAASADIEQVEAEEPVQEEEFSELETPESDDVEETVETEVEETPETTEDLPAETSEETEQEETTLEEETEVESEETPAETEEEDKDLEEQEEIEDGEIPEEGEADFEEGELDIEDVDTDVTEDDVAEATAEADEAEEEAAADEEEEIDASKTIEELQKEKAAVESFIGILKYGLEKGDFQPQFMIMAQSKLDELHKAFGEHAPSIPSMENYNRDTLDQYYTTSLESFRGFMSKIANLQRSLSEMIDKLRAGGLVKKVKTRAKALNKEVDLALVKLAEAKIGSVTIKGVSSDLATTDTNLAQAVAKDLRVLSEIAIKGLKDSDRVEREIVEVINKAVTDGGKGKTGPLVQQARNIKPAVYPKVTAGSLLGGWTLELETGARGNDSEIERLAYTLIPVAKKVKVEDRATSFDTSKGDLANMLKLAKAYVALADKLADSVGLKAIDNFTGNRIVRQRALDLGVRGGAATRATTNSEIDQMDELATVLIRVAVAHVSMYKFTAQHALDVADGIVGAVRKAL